MSNAFRDKLLTIQLSPQVKQPEARKNYHDQEALDRTFGADAHERMLDDTDGMGYARPVGDRLYHRPRGTGDPQPTTFEDYLDGPEDAA